jgi:hypothetical protein
MVHLRLQLIDRLFNHKPTVSVEPLRRSQVRFKILRPHPNDRPTVLVMTLDGHCLGGQLCVYEILHVWIVDVEVFFPLSSSF